MRHPLVSIALLGWVVATSQTTLLREVLAAARGSELALALALGMWLVLTAAGSLLAGALPARHAGSALLAAAMLAGPALFAGLLAARGLPRLLDVAPGALLGFDQQVPVLLVSLAPLCLAGGAVFAIACRLPMLAPAAVYLAEAVGWLAGGMTATWAVETWPPLALAGMLATASAAAGALFTGRLWIGPAAVGGLTVVALASGGMASLEDRSLHWRWPRQTLEASAYTRDGHAAVLSRPEQRALYEDGHLSVVLPERQGAEELVHLALAQVREPQRVFVARALGGLLPEILKHPVAEVVAAEPNPTVARLQVRAADPATAAAVRDGRVFFVQGDVRRQVRSGGPWDVILLNIPEPSTLLASRLLTVEFFAEARRAMRPGGVLAFALPGAENYYGPELVARNGSVWKALAHVFSSVAVTPLATNYFLAGDRPLSLDADTIARGLAERRVATQFVDRYSLAAMMPAERIPPLIARFRALATPLSSDRRSTVYFHDLLFAGRADAGRIARALGWALGLGIWPVGLGLAGVLLVPAAAAARLRRRELAPLAVVGTVGFAGMATTVLILVVTQSALGALHHLMGALLAANMAGLALGARLAPAGKRTSLLAAVALATLAVLALPLISRLGGSGPAVLVTAALVGLSLAAGAAVGVAFRAALAAGARPAVVYAVDLLGAATAAPAVAALLLPAHGLDAAALLVAALLVVAGLGAGLAGAPRASERGPLG